MTLPATTRRSPVYLGNGAVTTFPFTFKVFATTDIQVRLTSAAGVLTTAVLSTEYSVALNADQTVSPGGTVVYPVTGLPLATGASLVMIGNLPYDQTLALPAGGNFNPVAIERGLDRIEMQTQQIAELAGRAVRAPAGEALGDLPAAALRANLLLSFDLTGQPVAAAPVAGTATALSLSLVSSIGASLTGWLAAATGAIYATLADWLGWQRLNVMYFMTSTQRSNARSRVASGDCAAAFQAAVTAAGAAGGGEVFVPAGTYNCTTGNIEIPINVTVVGEGKRASLAYFRGVDDGFRSTWPANSSTAARLGLRSIGIVCDNVANTGAGFVDIGGTFVDVVDTFFQGFKYGVIFNQTEISNIERCEFVGQQPGGGGVWLVNGSDYLRASGALQNFTNVIRITNSAFNEGASTYGIINDGGLSHTFTANNYNGCLRHIRISGVQGLVIDGASDFEQAAEECILIQTTSLSGVAVINSYGIRISDGLFQPVATKNCIKVVFADSLLLLNNQFTNNASAAPAVAITACSFLTSIGNKEPNGYSLGTTNYYFLRDVFTTANLFIGGGAIGSTSSTLIFAAAVTPVADGAKAANLQVLTATDATAVTINTPSGTTTKSIGQTLTIRIRNASGGVMGNITWSAIYKMNALVKPASGFSKAITFNYDGTNWVESAPSIDVPN